MTRSSFYKRLSIMAAFVFGSVTGWGQVADSAKCMELTQQVHQHLTTATYEQVSVLLDSTMKARLDAERLKQAWEGLGQIMGGYKAVIDRQYIPLDSGGVAVMALQFKRGVLDLRISCAFDDSLIHGLFLVPGKKRFKYKKPDYVDTTAFNERSIQIPSSKQILLPGTLTLPKTPGKPPLVILVHGSGPNDRDDTLGPNKPFKDLAWGLASQGIAVLRYDKATKVVPEKFGQDITVMEETVYDAQAAVDLVQTWPEIDSTKIFILGHSLGGMLMPRIAVEKQQGLAGVMIVAGNTRPLEDLILEQTEYILGLDKLSDDDLNQIDALKEQIALIKDKNLAKQPDTLAPLGLPKGYWLDLRTYRPDKVAKQLQIPMFILQGERDY